MSESIERLTSVPRLPPRERDGHKGDYGRVLIVGGSRGMVGAVALAANAALRGSAGLVTFAAVKQGYVENYEPLTAFFRDAIERRLEGVRGRC